MNTDKLNNKVTETLINRVKIQTDKCFEALVVTPPHGRLPEDIFKGYFLPYFAGITKLDKEKTLITDWISIAGTPMSPVDIIDQSGTILFTVPPLMDTDIIETANKDAKKSLAEIYSQYDLRNNNIPIVANNYLMNALEDKFKTMTKVSEKTDTNKEIWESIFARYNIHMENELNVNASNTTDNDELIYD